MNRKIVLGICILLVLLCAIGTATAKTWYVDDSGGADFTNGDTSIVKAGIYTENVILNKKLTLLGEGIPTIDAQGSGSVIII